MNTCPRSCTRKASSLRLCLTLLVLLAAAGLASVGLGATWMSPGEILALLTGASADKGGLSILLFVRLPRYCASLLAGSALAVSGAVIQAVLGTPLAAPNIIGVNAGAGLLVAAGCALFPSAAWLNPALAFLGAFLGVALVLGISRRAGASRMSLVLAGVAISSVFAAGIDAIVTLAPDALAGYSDFRIGGFAGVTMERLFPAAAIIVPCILAVLALGRELEVLTLGAETAQSLGLPVRRIRAVLLVLAAALAGAAVSFCGLLGFVGLIVPHMARRLAGESGPGMLCASALGGALLLSLCDLIARTIAAPYVLPVGVVMSFVGGPVFIWPRFRQKGGRRG